MEHIIELLRSRSTSLSSAPKLQNEVAASKPTPSKSSTSSDMKPATSPLEALPAEIVTQILGFLPAISLAGLSQTSHLLRSHAHNDLLWMQFVRDIIPNGDQITSPLPAESWRDLYISHHPYWFLASHRIWFSDVPNTGMIVLARYNYRQGCIEAFRLIAEHGPHHFETWEHNPRVIIHAFNPRVKLWLDDPVVKLDLKDHDHGNRLQKEVRMRTGAKHGICSMISLCQPIPQSLQHPSMALWPPSIVPSVQRVRNESPNKFRTDGHRPRTLADASDRTFRIRKWMEFSNLMQPLSSVRMGEEVSTFSTLLEESYTPTREKPYQGIWVGDYSGHGCEFLLVKQRPVSSLVTLSTQSATGSLPQGMSISEMEAEGHPKTVEQLLAIEAQCTGNSPRFFETCQLSESTSDNNTQTASDGSAHDSAANEPCSGRLEAIKLTGDVNVRRGEYTWIAEDIGPKGLIRIADEQMFVGARTVKSWGRIAETGFRHDRFIPSQLIMISHDTLAQYWEDFGHISFYKRVNIDDYLNV
ncbi:hypothetical protein MMC28_005633 [Mycoblastus sanguinarius]|nr:hypothetical protein [Mycoblastus sanguinarius]